MGRMSDLDIELGEISDQLEQIALRIDALPLNAKVRDAVVELLEKSWEKLSDELSLRSTEW